MAVLATYEAKPGLGRARNRGLSVARGDIVGFTDDDCYPTPDYIDDILDIFRDREIGYAGGRIKLFNPRDWPISIVDKAETRIIEPFTYIDGPEMKILGANMAFRRTVLKQIGGFDDAFGAGGPFAFEDVDAFARASFGGWKGRIFPRADRLARPRPRQGKLRGFSHAAMRLHVAPISRNSSSAATARRFMQRNGSSGARANVCSGRAISCKRWAALSPIFAIALQRARATAMRVRGPEGVSTRSPKERPSETRRIRWSNRSLAADRHRRRAINVCYSFAHEGQVIQCAREKLIPLEEVARPMNAAFWRFIYPPRSPAPRQHPH